MYPNRSFVRALTGPVVIVGAASLSSGQSVILDTFDGPLGALGQDRILSETLLANPLNLSNPGEAEVVFDPGLYAFVTRIGVEAIGRIEYPLDSFNAAVLAIASFELDFVADQAFESEMTLTTDVGGSMESVSAVFVVPADTSTVTLSLGDFSGSGDFDLSDVDSVTLAFNVGDAPTPSLDLALTEFRALVPAPGGVAIFSFGTVAMIGTRRRRA